MDGCSAAPRSGLALVCLASGLVGCEGGEGLALRGAADGSAARPPAMASEGGAAVGAAPLPTWDPSPRSCPMAHCDPRMSDAVAATVPTGDVGILWRDVGAGGSNIGLGCSSNGSLIACTLGGTGKPGPYLKVYDARGRVQWSSGLLSSSAFASAAMIDARGSVIATDSEVIARFDPGGQVRWSTPTAGGLPISPVLTAGGVVVLATKGGPVSIYDVETGEMLDSLTLAGEAAGVAGAFTTRNTPCVRADRIYVSTEFEPEVGATFAVPVESRPARLYALDVDRGAPPGQRIRPAWSFEFGARSGSSPLRIGDTVYFDGDRTVAGGPLDPHLFAVEDRGPEPRLKWQAPLDAEGLASAAQDPRGGLWSFGFETTDLVRFDADDGHELQRIDMDALIDEPGVHGPLSAMSFGVGPEGQPVLVSTAAEITTKESWLFALDVEAERLLWKVRYSQDGRGWGGGQYPVALQRGGQPVVVFTSAARGIFAVGRR